MNLVTYEELLSSHDDIKNLEITDLAYVNVQKALELKNPSAVCIYDGKTRMYLSLGASPSFPTNLIGVPQWVYNCFQSKHVGIEPIYPPNCDHLILIPFQKEIHYKDESMSHSLKKHSIFQKNIVFPLLIDGELIFFKAEFKPDKDYVTLRGSNFTIHINEPIQTPPVFVGRSHKLGGSTNITPREAFLNQYKIRNKPCIQIE